MRERIEVAASTGLVIDIVIRVCAIEFGRGLSFN